MSLISHYIIYSTSMGWLWFYSFRVECYG